MKYCAFLRGINLGPNRRVKMDVLAKVFQDMGFQDVWTVIASGNVVFETQETSEERLKEKIEAQLQKSLGFEVPIFLRSIPELQDLIKNHPFGNLEENENTKLHVVFVPRKIEVPKDLLKSEKNGYEIKKITETAIYVATFRIPNGHYGDLLALAKVLGKAYTIRNWNTVVKIAGM